VKEKLVFIWNGGLDPVTGDPTELQQRRTMVSMTSLLLPVALILMFANAFVLSSPERNIFIGGVLTLNILGLYLQAYQGLNRLAVSILIATFWIGPTSIMLQQGLNTSNWVWLLPIALIANLVGDRKTAVIWTAVSVITLVVVSSMTIKGHLVVSVSQDTHAIIAAISGSLILMLICLCGYFFRTAQIKSERKLKAHVERLGEEVQTRRQAEQAALAGERAKAVFLTTVSHELRTPLNGVIGAGQLLSGTQLDKHQQELIDVVTNSGEILLDLINNVLDLSRLEAGRLELEQEALHVDSVIKSAIAPLIIPGKNKNLSIDYKISPEVPKYILGDAIRLRQIILNLCGNALKFTHSGEVRVVVSSHSSQIKIDVIDTGIGIADEVKDKLFQPFTQAETSTARRFGGSGLGLSIVAQLVRLLGGRVSVESELGVGSTFTVLLPLRSCQPPLHKIDKGVASQSRHWEPLTVLVTDDNSVNRLVATKMLKKLKHKVIEATDGIEALEAVKKGNIDVVLMDVQMPNMDGLTATSHIRAMDGPASNMPIVGLTANAMQSDESELLAAGMDVYLSKPVRLEELQQALSTITPSRFD